MTLQQAVLIAYARSPLLASARADVAIATAPVSLAQSAIFPNVAGVASTTRSHREERLPRAAPEAAGTGLRRDRLAQPQRDQQQPLLQVQQLIFDGGRVAAQIRQARANQSASISTYQRQLQTVAFNVATAYYNALAAQRQTQVALTTVTLDQVQENLVSAQIRAGTAARTDLATAQLPTAQARVAVIRAQAAELNQLAVLSNTLGLDADVTVQPKDDVPALSATNGTVALTPDFPTPSYQTALTRAVALRPDLAAAAAEHRLQPGSAARGAPGQLPQPQRQRRRTAPPRAIRAAGRSATAPRSAPRSRSRSTTAASPAPRPRRRKASSTAPWRSSSWRSRACSSTSAKRW